MTQSDTFLHPDRLLPTEGNLRTIARDLYDSVSDLPIISPHGHTLPHWFAENQPMGDAADLFLTPDHYVLRMLYSHGISYEALGVPRNDGGEVASGREAWNVLAEHYHLFLGTPSRLWIDHSMNWAFGIDQPLSPDNADAYFDLITDRLQQDDCRPMALLDKAKVDYIATTEFALDPLTHHANIGQQGLSSRIATTYRPDDVTDPDNPDFQANIRALGEVTGQDVESWSGLIEAHRIRRAFFRDHGASATDHGVPSAQTLNLSETEKQVLLTLILSGDYTSNHSEQFRAQMLTEMAGLSCEDGMVMQIHAGSRRNTDPRLMKNFGANLGADIPVAVNPVIGLEPLLQRYGDAEGFRLLFFCLDETVYARELAPLVGYWPALRSGPPWWFHDSPRGIARYLDGMVETAGFHNLAGFNDDTRALLSIPARHDVWRRCVCSFLTPMVAQGVLGRADADQMARWLSYDAALDAYAIKRA
ncbi:MAG: glucuronate isomerase [Rhizobiaceae bacterium]